MKKATSTPTLFDETVVTMTGVRFAIVDGKAYVATNLEREIGLDKWLIAAKAERALLYQVIARLERWIALAERQLATQRQIAAASA